ncbi:AAA family ATPase [Thiocystis violacea]|uniref:AAA family ATPase n=1 Tax=Thiocystis violacea TaxID=13725 RepID=UPI0019045A30|nr:AAA family ATPase [Thiocystis violacea]MBK1724326.1 ATPase [Thiocystis violacea]
MTPDLHDLELLLRSDTPIILIESIEELRVIELFSRLALRVTEPAFRWTVTDGLQRIEFDAEPQHFLADPAEVLRHIRVTTQRGIYILLDFHPYLDKPLHVRLLKEIAQGYVGLPRTLIMVSHALEVPPELRHLSVRFSLRLPDRNRLMALIREEAKLWQQIGPHGSVRTSRGSLDQLADNLLGITESDARRLIRNAIRNDGAITKDDVESVKRAKYELLSPEGIISFEYDTRSFADVAGLSNLKAWIDRRRDAFLDPERTRDHPRGILMLGVQGGGKSLAAKAVAGRLGVPLLRLDFGALYDKYIGETEKNLRKALETADLMSPCVLWVDEIEKGIATGSEDDGVGRRVLGTLLTWMAERKTRVFLAATANDISRLPPELIRKGRIDELFFVDLPPTDVRREIFVIHLRQRQLDPETFDLDALAEASEGFTGAGIEQAVVSALFADATDKSAVTTATLLAEIASTQPLSVVMDVQIQRLRAWAKERTVPAHAAEPSRASV